MQHKRTDERPRLIDIASGLVEARLTHVDFLDTTCGDELRRLFRHRQELRRAQHGPGRAHLRHGRDVRELHAEAIQDPDQVDEVHV